MCAHRGPGSFLRFPGPLAGVVSHLRVRAERGSDFPGAGPRFLPRHSSPRRGHGPNWPSVLRRHCLLLGQVTGALPVLPGT